MHRIKFSIQTKIEFCFWFGSGSGSRPKIQTQNSTSLSKLNEMSAQGLIYRLFFSDGLTHVQDKTIARNLTTFQTVLKE